MEEKEEEEKGEDEGSEYPPPITTAMVIDVGRANGGVDKFKRRG